MANQPVTPATDSLYGWLYENERVKDPIVIEGTGEPGHPVRMELTFITDDGQEVPISLAVQRR